MVNEVTLGAALRSTMMSINRTQNTIDIITERLASGLEVNSAIDDPKNFFVSRSLKNEASDSARLLDGINQSIRTIQEGIIGLEATERLLEQGEAVVLESQKKLQTGVEDLAVFEKIFNVSPRSLDAQIISAAPDVYYRLNETAGPIVDSGFGGAGPVAATYGGGAAPNAGSLYTNGSQPSVNFDGINERINVADSSMINTATTPARTIELVFNADTVAGRQVLYEEGATVNGFTIYIDNGLVRFEAEDDQGAGRFGNLDISSPVVAGQTYHVALVFDGPGDSVAGFVNGVNVGTVAVNSEGIFPSHSGNIGIGGAADGVQFHDGEAGSAGFYFDGRISNVAIYNRALSDTELLNHGTSLDSATSSQFQNRDFNSVLEQLDRIVIDANYRGINLLKGDDLRTDFNSERTSSLTTEGEDFSVNALGIKNFDFTQAADIENILDQLSTAKTKVREFAFTLSNDLSVIQIRSAFTQEAIITLEGGADDLTVADQNEEGANLLATQTRLALGTTALSFASQAQNSIIDLFGRNQ